MKRETHYTASKGVLYEHYEDGTSEAVGAAEAAVALNAMIAEADIKRAISGRYPAALAVATVITIINAAIFVMVVASRAS